MADLQESGDQLVAGSPPSKRNGARVGQILAATRVGHFAKLVERMDG